MKGGRKRYHYLLSNLSGSYDAYRVLSHFSRTVFSLSRVKNYKKDNTGLTLKDFENVQYGPVIQKMKGNDLSRRSFRGIPNSVVGLIIGSIGTFLI